MNDKRRISFSNGDVWILNRPYVMGVVNATPDSFFEDSRFLDEGAFLAKVEEMVLHGVDIVDIGGVSTRPGSEMISLEEEAERTIDKVEVCKRRFPRLKISIDTQRAELAKQAADVGVDMINDISAGAFSKGKMFEVAKQYRLPIVLMHMLGNPKTMQKNPTYERGVVEEVSLFFDKKLKELDELQIGKEKIIIDPGIGFGKTVEHNLDLFRNVSAFVAKGCAVLIGASMKSMFEEICHAKTKQRLPATLGAHLCALFSGANIVRVHDVAAAKHSIKSFLSTLPQVKIPEHLSRADTF